jgi:hypothetical protein
MTALFLAECQRAFDEAQTAREFAVDKAQALRVRIDQSRRILDAITASRLEGNVTPGDVAEFAVVSADLVALQKLLDTAEMDVAALDIQPARDALRGAEKQHARDQDQQAFDAWTLKIAALENALCNSALEAHQVGQRLGHASLHMSWRISKRLEYAVKHGVLNAN